MARVYSQSQGRFIDVPEQGAVAPTTGAMGAQPTQPTQATGGGLAGGNEQLYNLLMGMGLRKAGTTEGGRIGAFAQYLRPPEETEGKRNKELARQEAEQIIKTIEDFYFGNKLHYGFTPEGVKRTMVAKVNPNSPLGIYSRFIKSKGVSLAKAAGDVGNIAWVEQKAQLNAMASGLYDYNSAVTQFNLVREGFNLPTRDYSKVTPIKTDISSIIQKYGGQQSGY